MSEGIGKRFGGSVWLVLCAWPLLTAPAARAQGGGPFGEIGANDFRISFQGGTGDPLLAALDAAVAYNPAADEYLVVWSGSSDCLGGGGDTEIRARRVDGTTGALLGQSLTLSEVGPPCDLGYQAFSPAVTYNAAQDEFLVVWWGEDDVGGLVDDELEIFGQRLQGEIQVGADDFRISDMGGTGNTTFAALYPAVTWNETTDEYLVVWWGTDDEGGLSPGEVEIFGQRLDPSGAQIGVNDFRISEMGGTGDRAFAATFPAVARNAAQNEYLVVWSGDSDAGGLVNDEFEIFGQLLNASGTEIGVNDFRISDMGGTGDPAFAAFDPAVTYNGTRDEYLVVWRGDDNLDGLTDDENEIFGQRLDALGTAIGANDFRISDMGGTGDPAFDAGAPAVAWNATRNQYLVAWHGDDHDAGLADDELEIFAQRLDALGVEISTNDLRIPISDLGGTGNPAFDASIPAVAWNATRDEYLVTWYGDDNVGGLVDNELEIFGQRLGDPLLFADGFEAGGTGAWDVVVE